MSIRPTFLIAMFVNANICGRLVNRVAGRKLAQTDRDGIKLLGPFIAARRNDKKEGKTVRRFPSVSSDRSLTF